MKTKEELKILKEEVEDLKMKLAELSEDELAVVTGGSIIGCVKGLSSVQYDICKDCRNFVGQGVCTAPFAKS